MSTTGEHPALRAVTTENHVPMAAREERAWLKGLVAGLGALVIVLGVMGGFAAWVITEARAQGMGALREAENASELARKLDAGMRGDIAELRRDMNARQTVVEQKVGSMDQKLDVILREVRRR